MQIRGVTREQVERLSAAIGEGSTVVKTGADNYHIESQGITADATFNDCTGTLTIEVKTHPAFLTLNAIRTAIEQALSE